MASFTDRPYRRSHGAAPRGRGSWAFQASRTDTAFDRDLEGDVLWSPGAMTLTEAKRWASSQVPAHFLLAVLP